MTDEPIGLRELMQLAGLTFKALGKRIGMNQARVFKSLTGEITLRPEVAKKMEDAILDAARERAARLAAVLGVVIPSSNWQQDIGMENQAPISPSRERFALSATVCESK